jgi:hypothetical protein
MLCLYVWTIRYETGDVQTGLLIHCQTVTGTFDLYTTFRNVAFENWVDRIDFCLASKAGINNIFITDLDGSLNYPNKVSNTPATLVSNHQSMLEFINNEACELYEDRCYRYCPETCFRTIRCETDPAETSSLFLRVCGSFFVDSCIVAQGRLREDDEEDSALHPRVFLANVPKGRYTVTIVNAFGVPVWPSFVNVYLDKETCDDGFLIGDVSIQTPLLTTVNQCNDLIRNGNFEQSNTKPTYWLTRRGGKLRVVQGLDRSNAASGVTPSSELVITQFLDNRCLTTGTWYVIRANIQIMQGQRKIMCNPESQRCPQIGLHTDDAGFYLVATMDPIRLNAHHNVEGFIQIDSQIEKSSAVSIYIASRQSLAIVVDNVFMSRIDPDSYCRNLIRGFTDKEEQDEWEGLWTSNVRSSADLDMVRPDQLSRTALRLSNRASSDEGPLYAGIRNIEIQCLRPGTKWLIVGHFMLVDRTTGLKTTCDPTKVNACPSIRLAMRDESRNLFIVQERISTYPIETWNPNGFNKLQGVLELPDEAEWDGKVSTFNFEIVGFPANYDLIFDQVMMSSI